MELSDDLPIPWILAKAALFLLVVLLAVGLIWALTLDGRVLLILGITVWASCRLYYFFFYVIEKYVDPTFRFSGMFSLLRWLRTQGRERKNGG